MRRVTADDLAEESKGWAGMTFCWDNNGNMILVCDIWGTDANIIPHCTYGGLVTKGKISLLPQETEDPAPLPCGQAACNSFEPSALTCSNCGNFDQAPATLKYNWNCCGSSGDNVQCDCPDNFGNNECRKAFLSASSP